MRRSLVDETEELMNQYLQNTDLNLLDEPQSSPPTLPPRFHLPTSEDEEMAHVLELSRKEAEEAERKQREEQERQRNRSVSMPPTLDNHSLQELEDLELAKAISLSTLQIQNPETSNNQQTEEKRSPQPATRQPTKPEVNLRSKPHQRSEGSQVKQEMVSPRRHEAIQPRSTLQQPTISSRSYQTNGHANSRTTAPSVGMGHSNIRSTSSPNLVSNLQNQETDNSGTSNTIVEEQEDSSVPQNRNRRHHSERNESSYNKAQRSSSMLKSPEDDRFLNNSYLAAENRRQKEELRRKIKENQQQAEQILKLQKQLQEKDKQIKELKQEIAQNQRFQKVFSFGKKPQPDLDSFDLITPESLSPNPSERSASRVSSKNQPQNLGAPSISTSSSSSSNFQVPNSQPLSNPPVSSYIPPFSFPIQQSYVPPPPPYSEPQIDERTELVNQQNEEYFKSLMEDQRKEAEKKENEETQIAQELSKQTTIESLEKELQNEPTDPGSFLVKINFPNGTRISRRFVPTDKIGVLKQFITLHGLKNAGTVPDNFKIVIPYPKQDLTDIEKTFQDYSITSNTAVTLESI